jgi:hypothetical protein
LFSSALWWSQDVHVIHPPWVIGIIVELSVVIAVLVTNLWLLAPVVFWLRTIFTLRVIGVILSTVSLLVVLNA